MEEYWFEHKLSDTVSLTISTITHKDAEEVEADFCDGWGYYLCLWDKEADNPKKIMAKFVSEEEAVEFSMLLTANLKSQAL